MTNLKPLSDEDAQRLHALLVEAGTILGAGPLGMVNAPTDAPIRRKMEVFAEHHIARIRRAGMGECSPQPEAREMVEGLLRILDTDPTTFRSEPGHISGYRTIIGKIRENQ